ncbi:MAG: tetratricopeptide repeat protein [Xanthomonadales bacterium]|nr:tetratricopeptide repeat protein [Xanthomonadales bacterium]
MKQAEIARWNKASDLLGQVLDLPPGQRQAAVSELGERHGVPRELASLYASSEGTCLLDDTLDSVLAGLPDPAPAPNALHGQVLGHWQLDEEIGRGGMSVVYHAHRTGQDFEQQAALKILSVGHLGENFVSGFLRERQILSDLQHPGIARLIDGGLTPDGAPYLVMQHVEGERIDRWCVQRNAHAATVVGIIRKLCDAVAYAHRHLVIHQDIKPANVLVDEHERPILIDFGIASLLRPSGETAALRAFTPHYAAPEQREAATITTATDVYALGMLSRKLLENQRIDADLQAVLAVATHADPEQRYANARSFSDDLRAWLEKRPVAARPATLGYRAGRFVTRNRWGVAAAAMVLLSLLVGLGAALWQARIAALERDLARAESVRATQAIGFLKELFSASDPDRARGTVVTARELLDQGAHQVRNAMQDSPALQAEMLVLLGDLYRELGESAAAGPLLEDGLALADTSGDITLRVEARRALALNRMEDGDHNESLSLAQQAETLLREQQRVPGRQHSTLAQPILFSLAELGRVPEAVERADALLARILAAPDLDVTTRYNYLSSIGNVMLIAEDRDRALALLAEAAELAGANSISPSAQIALRSNLGGILDRVGDLQGALQHRRAVMSLVDEIYPPIHPERARMLSNLATTLNALGQYDEAERALREALGIYEKLHGGVAHPRVAAAHNNLAQALQRAGNPVAAEPHLRRAWELAAELFGEQDPRYVVASGNLGNLYRQLGDWNRSERLLAESLELRLTLLGEQHPSYGTGLGLLAALRLDQGQWEAALHLSEEALAVFDGANRPNPRAVVASRTRRAQALGGLGRHDEARMAFERSLTESEPIATDLGRQWLDLLAAYADFLVARSDPAAGDAIGRALAAHRELLGEDHPATRQLQTLDPG